MNEIWEPTLEIIFADEEVDLEVMLMRAQSAVGNYKRLFKLREERKQKIGDRDVRNASRIADALVVAYYKEYARLNGEHFDEEEEILVRLDPDWFPESNEDEISYSLNIIPYEEDAGDESSEP